MTSNYVGLNNVTMYSAQRSLLTIDNIVDSAARAGHKAAAITDINNLHGTYQFIKACSKANIKPIIGANILINNNLDEKNRDNSPVILLAKSPLGYANICQLITKAHIDGFYYVPRISYDWLEEYSDDLICISGPYGPISSAITKFESEELANFYYQKLKNIFKNNLFVATAPVGHYYEGEKAGRLANQFIESKYNNVIIVNNSRILNKTDSDYFNMMTAMRTKKPYDPSHNERYNQLYIKSDAELKREFDYFDKSCCTINQIVEQCNFQFDKSYKFPHTGIDNPSGYIDQLIADGLRRNEHKLVKDKSVYLDRIQRELDVIKSNGFLDYFIIVQDIVRFARENNIYVGPGRGSVGGSLVAYCLDIHDFDPIKHGLYFERFLNKDRVSMPDIDLDFEHLRREEVVQYIYDKYGHDKTANIGNVMTLGLRMAMKDVAKSLGVPFEDANQMTRLVPKKAETFEDCKKDKRFMQKYNEDIILRNIMKYVSVIGGSMRGTSTHAAGVVVAPSSITDYTPLQLDKKTGKTITQFDMTAIDGIGLIKLDLLGLKTMSIIHNAVDYIKVKHNKDIDIRNLNLNSKQTYKTIADGHTSAIFQLESQGITEMAKKLKISKFEEVRDLVALYRPGALDSKQDLIYINNKLGNEYRPIHPSLGEILKDTKGILLFQESYMDAAVKLAGFSPSEADLLRKYIGKKQKDLLAQSKAQWIRGCEKKGISRKDAEKIFEAFEAAGRYAFNRCLTGDTVVTRAGKGSHCSNPDITIQELFNAQNSNTSWGKKIRSANGIQILQLHDDQRIRPGFMKKIHYNGFTKVYELNTKNGKHIKATHNHRLLTNNGYKEIKNIVIGDQLVCVGQKEKYAKKGLAIRGLGTKYNAPGVRGFPKGEKNPSHIDGRQVCFDNMKKIVYSRADNKCEICGQINANKKHSLELAHIRTLNDLNNDYSLYHNPNNVMLLCNSCHKSYDYKKGERKKRWSKGLPFELDEVVRITYAGEEDVYDIEMRDEPHNFLANGIISHNSHSVAYGYLSYVTAALKTFYPLEFMTSHLQVEYKETDKFDRYRKECRRLGINIEAPSINKSDSNFIMDYDNNSIIYGLSAIKGVGEIAAQNIVEQRTKPYKSFTDFMRRINHNIVNKKVLISLIQSGCFDCLQEYNRETLMHNIQDVISFYRHMDLSKVLIVPEPKLKVIKTSNMYNVYAAEKELMGISF